MNDLIERININTGEDFPVSDIEDRQIVEFVLKFLESVYQAGQPTPMGNILVDRTKAVFEKIHDEEVVETEEIKALYDLCSEVGPVVSIAVICQLLNGYLLGYEQDLADAVESAVGQNMTAWNKVKDLFAG